MRPRGILFDFNGTLSDDEPVLYAIYAELCAEQGHPLGLREAVAFVVSAKAAGIRAIGLTRTLGRARLAAADELVEAIDPGLMRRLLASPGPLPAMP